MRAELLQRTEHSAGRGHQAEHDDARAPQELSSRATPVVKRQPIANKSRWNIGNDGGFLAVMAFMFAEHGPDIGDAQPLELAMPLPSVLAIGPSVFERKGVRFHDEPPPAHLAPSFRV